jgi:hypothetical protein
METAAGRAVGNVEAEVVDRADVEGSVGVA